MAELFTMIIIIAQNCVGILIVQLFLITDGFADH
jgi:hypothetical protein